MLWFGRGRLVAWLVGRSRRSGRVYLDIGTLEGNDMLEDARWLRIARLHGLHASEARCLSL